MFGSLVDLKGAFGGGAWAVGLVKLGKIVAEGFLVVADEGGELGMGVDGEDVEAVEDWF